MVSGAHKVLRRQDIMFEDKDQALRDDVRTLGTMVGDLIREQGGDDRSHDLDCPAHASFYARAYAVSFPEPGEPSRSRAERSRPDDGVRPVHRLNAR